MSKIKNIIYRLIDLVRTEKQVPIITSLPQSQMLENKVAMISGGTGGIGISIAQKFLADGCSVIITGTSSKSVEKGLEKLNSDSATGVILDMQSANSFKKKVDEASRIFGKIDILVNCAGLNDSSSFLDVTEEIYDRIMNVNSKGVYFLTQAVAKYMIKNELKGHILNISSASALRPASTPYTISKWTVAGMTKGFADVLIKYGITVNAIAPGPVATEMVGVTNLDDIGHKTSPSSRYALPEEIANLAEYLVSSQGDLIVGETVYITGGSGTISYHN